MVKYQGGQVTFRYKDYAHGGQGPPMTLWAQEFIRRFRCTCCRRASCGSGSLAFSPIVGAATISHAADERLASSSCQTLVASAVEKIAPPTSWPCPRCGGPMIVIERLTALQIHARAFAERIGVDTS